jgi:hypothetical protein
MITDFIIDNMMQWHHSGFNVYCGKTLWPGNALSGQHFHPSG